MLSLLIAGQFHDQIDQTEKNTQNNIFINMSIAGCGSKASTYASFFTNYQQNNKQMTSISTLHDIHMAVRIACLFL